MAGLVEVAWKWHLCRLSRLTNLLILSPYSMKPPHTQTQQSTQTPFKTKPKHAHKNINPKTLVRRYQTTRNNKNCQVSSSLRACRRFARLCRPEVSPELHPAIKAAANRVSFKSVVFLVSSGRVDPTQPPPPPLTLPLARFLQQPPEVPPTQKFARNELKPACERIVPAQTEYRLFHGAGLRH